ncbi:MAG: cupin domain-containing protein [Bacteroidales bacterium]|nr:cupin domain-containing protein [Bacteroidales bacterium]
MNSKNGNFFSSPENPAGEQEIFETLFNGGDFSLERICTKKDYKEPGRWYDQEKDEWVLLLQGSAALEFEDGRQIRLETGDYVFIPARQKHRVAYTRGNPECIWLAIHGYFRVT